MKIDARELDQLVRDWCLGTSPSQDLLQRIAQRAITAETSNVVPFARALQILGTHEQPPKIKERIERLRHRLEALQMREWQIDDLGNPDNEPQLIFDILGNELEDLNGFDLPKIRQAQHSGSTRAESVKAMLQVLGWDRLPTDTSGALKLAIEDLGDREQYTAWGLFVDRSVAQGWALGINIAKRDAGQAMLWSEADNEIYEQARIALAAALPGQGWEATIEFPASYAGESIGLPLYVAGLVLGNRIQRHALTASTGRLDISGGVTGVSGIKEKIEAARRIGIRRVLVPRENFEEAKPFAGADFLVVPVANVSDVVSAFRQSLTSVELGHSGLVRLVRASVPDYELVVKTESPEAAGHRFVVANAQGTANIWVYTNGRLRSDGPAGPARDAAERLIQERGPKEPEQREVLSFQLPKPSMQERYKSALFELGAVQEAPHNHEQWRMRISKGRSRATVVLYTSAQCVIQGTAPAWDDAYAAAKPITDPIGGLPNTNSTNSRRPTTTLSREPAEPHIGTDEAGKGDYFGPLVSAAVFVDGESAQKLRKLGVRDSKTLSDGRIRELSEQIRKMPGVKYAVTAINPRKFNELYETFRREGKNLNSLLAWGHARSIDTLLSVPSSQRVHAKYVLVDQFADKHYIEERTRKAGIPIHQRPKAEEDIAVAAASVLARDGFVRWLERMSQRTQITLPKGASAQVIEAGKKFVRKWGARWLGEVAKLNFRTTARVLEGEEKSTGDGAPQWISEQSEPKSEG
jgi:ribonuclease HIII